MLEPRFAGTPLLRLLRWEQEVASAGFDAEACALLAHRCRSLPQRDSHPRFLVAVVTTDRPAGLGGLVHSLALARERFGYRRDGVALLVLDNSALPGSRAANRAMTAEARRQGIPAEKVEIPSLHGWLERVREQDLIPPFEAAPAPIGTARMALTAALWGWAKRGRYPDLPHESDGRGPVAVWMVDDDMALEQLVVVQGRRFVTPATSLLHRLALLRQLHPGIDVLIGGNTGDPPIPAADCLQNQLHDVLANLADMRGMALDDRWRPLANDRSCADFYYDLTRGRSPLEQTFRWESPSPRPTVSQAALELLRSAPGLLYGRQVTRPLLWTATGEAGAAPSLERGGNAVFFNLDALFQSAYPCCQVGPGVVTRRADNLWALTGRRQGMVLEAAPFPLLHGRWSSDGSSPMAGSARASGGAVQRQLAAQIAGVVVCRLVERGLDRASPESMRDAAQELLRARLAQTKQQLAAVAELIQEIRAIAASPHSWRDPALSAELQRFCATLEELERCYPLDERPLALPVDLDRLVRFTHGLGERASRMKELMP